MNKTPRIDYAIRTRADDEGIAGAYASGYWRRRQWMKKYRQD